MKRRLAVRAIVMNEGKLLCVRLKPYEGALSTSATDDWWCLPGGGLDLGEALVPGLERELIEETAIKPKIGALLYLQQFATPDTETEHLEFFFHVTNADDYLNVDLSKASHGAIEIEEIAFVDPKTTNVLPKFLATEPLEAHIAAKAPAKIFSYLS